MLFLLVDSAVGDTYIGYRRHTPAETPLTAEERARLDELLKAAAEA